LPPAPPAHFGLFGPGAPCGAEQGEEDRASRGQVGHGGVGTGYGELFVCREEIGLRGLRDLV
jgi:hypothetical protein